ncbi:hypothetical protein Hamer_G011078 [Homarus americanus]|uniref:Uncharacterized protein n=1 Tax=Homarus americanus TaxID=6706 RepID=A0A8J5MX63_HOMAM|nr:hypothetical protein Hamer_G011078 [Homarus americanus]
MGGRLVVEAGGGYQQEGRGTTSRIIVFLLFPIQRKHYNHHTFVSHTVTPHHHRHTTSATMLKPCHTVDSGTHGHHHHQEGRCGCVTEEGHGKTWVNQQQRRQQQQRHDGFPQ